MKKSFTKPKLWKVMKICAVQGMMAVILCGMSMAHDNYAQLLDKKVTLSLKEVSLEAALKELEVVTNVKIFYSIDQHQSELTEQVSVEAVEQTLRTVLDELLAPHQIKYKVYEKELTIILRKRDQTSSKDESRIDEPTRKVETQHLATTISGRVTDAVTQQPMAGVNIIVKGTTNGTTTDSEGKFSIEVNEDDVIIFSFIGYASFETKINGRSVIDVSLKEDAKNLNEVVVNAGYYETTKEFQTGSIVKIEAKDIEKQPVSNPMAALQGRVTGLEVTQQNGVPGGNFKVRIRGTNSIANGNDPLYIIDGVPYTSTSMSFLETSGNILGSPGPNASQGSGPLNSINPSDIESIEVLKDADATAIYGSRGANGVILITTKRGQKGKTNVDFNFYTGAAKLSSKMNLLNTQQYVEMRKEAFKNNNMIPTGSNAPDLLVWDTTRYTDWQEELIGGTASISDMQFSISGGDNNTQFLIGTGYHRETTVFPGDNSDQRVSVHANINNTSADQRFKTLFSVNYSTNFTELLNQDLTSAALTLPPNAPEVYTETGELNWVNWIGFENPMAYTKRIFEATTGNLIGNSVISYAILPSLEIRANLGYTNIRNDATTIFPISSLSPSAVQSNNSTFSSSHFQNWIAEPQLNWKPKLGPGYFNILGGATFLSQVNEGYVQNARGYSSEALMKNIGAAPTIASASNYYSQYRYQAFFGRVNYTFHDRYIINITGRRDGSSRFGPGKQFSVFGAVGAAWIFSNESFIKEAIPFLSFGKLRSSYGITGNDQIGDYQYLDTYKSSGSYQGTVGLAPQRLSNPIFAWEENRKLEGSIDLGFLEDRIYLGVNYYHNRSSNQLVGAPLAPTTGFGSIQANFPATVQNSGIEIELKTQNIQKSDFIWSTIFNITIPRNKLVQFPDMESFPAYVNTYVVGEPLEIRKLYHYTGISPENGIYQFEDVNKDGAYTVTDLQTVRFVGRKFYCGILNSFAYKGFQLDVFFQYVKQQGYDYQAPFYSAPGTILNQPNLVTDRWRLPGDDADIQLYTTSGSSYTNLRSSDHVITDASFIRLKNLSLSYTIPSDWTKKLHMTNFNVFLQGQNLLTITKYRGLDPEIPGTIYLPPLRTLTGGIHLTF